jgi:broad specificity phosphatase PhoE
MPPAANGETRAYAAPVLESIAFVRHGRTAYNAIRRLNGDPAVDVRLNAAGISQVAALRPVVARLPIDLGVHTRFPRTRHTLDLLLAGRDVPRAVCPDLDDVLLGEFEGADVEAYRAWRRTHGPADAPVGGESRFHTLARYARGLERLLAVSARMPLVVTHDIPIRFIQNAVRGANPIDGPVRNVENGSLTVLSATDLTRALGVMRQHMPRAPV